MLIISPTISFVLIWRIYTNFHWTAPTVDIQYLIQTTYSDSPIIQHITLPSLSDWLPSARRNETRATMSKQIVSLKHDIRDDTKASPLLGALCHYKIIQLHTISHMSMLASHFSQWPTSSNRGPFHLLFQYVRACGKATAARHCINRENCVSSGKFWLHERRAWLCKVRSHLH